MAAPIITSALRAGGNRSSAFTYTIVAAGATSFNAALSAGGLPPGLSINTTTGVLSGTPTSSSISTIRLSATNVDGTGVANLELHISRAGAPFITSAYMVAGTVGVASPTFQITTGGGTPTLFGASGLPAGLTINTATGAITGTPTTSGTFLALHTASNSSGNDRLDITYIIAASGGTVPVINSLLVDSGLVGSPYSYQITASNTPTFLTASPLPPGLFLADVSSGHIIGTPTAAGTYSIGLSAMNGSGTGTATLMLTINSTLPGGDAGIPTGVFVRIENGANIPTFVTGDPDIDGVRISASWSQIEKNTGIYDFSYYRDRIKQAAAAGKKVIIRIATGAGPKDFGGNVPTNVWTAIGGSTTSKAVIPGTTYTFDTAAAAVVTFAVPWATTYATRKKAIYTALGSYLNNTLELTTDEKAAVVAVEIALANSDRETWDMPHGVAVVGTGGPTGTGYALSEKDRWLSATGSGGAAYTTQKVLDAHIKADNTGLIDAIMAAFIGKSVAFSISQQGTLLDATAAMGIESAEFYLPHLIATTACTKYPGRFVTWKNIVSTQMPPYLSATGTAWEPIALLHAAMKPVAGEALYFVVGDTADSGGSAYTMNGGTANDPDGVIPNPPGLTFEQIYSKAAERLATYGAAYYIVYAADAKGERAVEQAYVRSLFTGDSLGGAPVITSALTLDTSVGAAVNYQITASNTPDAFGGTPPFPLAIQVDQITGLVSGFFAAEGVYNINLFAQNAFGRTAFNLFVTVLPAGSGIGGTEPPFRQFAAPEIAVFSEDFREPCVAVGAENVFNEPSAVVDLLVVTPNVPDSGTATATWGTPLTQI